MAILKDMPDGSAINLRMVVSIEPIISDKYEVIMENNSRKIVKEADISRETMLSDIEAAHI